MKIQYRFQAETSTMNNEGVGWMHPSSWAFSIINRTIELTYGNTRYSVLRLGAVIVRDT